MSIIYDALNKTQEKLREQTNPPKPKLPRLKPTKSMIKTIIFIILFITIFSSIIIYFYHHHFSKHPVSITASPPSAMASYHNAKSYELSGVFLSNRNKVAIINHAYYHIGDRLDGMKVVGMNINEVQLKDKDHILVLSMLH